MIPVMMRFWASSSSQQEPPPPAGELCEDTYGNFYPDLYDDFSGSGAIDGELVEYSNNREWTYSSVSATKSGGSVSPATFKTVYANSFVNGNKMLLKVDMAASETLTVTVDGGFDLFRVELTLGSGDACTFTYDTEDGDPISDTFSIGNTPGIITIGFDLDTTYNESTEEYESHAYLAPNLVSSPVATLAIPPFGISYTSVEELDFSCTGSSTSVDYFRVCASSAG